MPDYSQSPYTDQLAGVIARLLRSGELGEIEPVRPPGLLVAEYWLGAESKLVSFVGDRVHVLGDSFGRLNLEFSNGVRVPNVKPGARISMPYEYVTISTGNNFVNANVQNARARLVFLAGAANYDEQLPVPGAVIADVLGNSKLGYTTTIPVNNDPNSNPTKAFPINGASKLRVLIDSVYESMELVPFYRFSMPGLNIPEESGEQGISPASAGGAVSWGLYEPNLWYEDSANTIVLPSTRPAGVEGWLRTAVLDLVTPTYGYCYLKPQNVVGAGPGTVAMAVQAIG